MAYTGVSIVDYLNSNGQNSSFASRQAIAKANGISNYTGTADQNNTLLAYLNKPQSPAPTTVKTTTPAPIVTTPTVTTKPTTTPAPVSTTDNKGVTTTKSSVDTSGLKADATTVADAYKSFNANAGDLQSSIEASAKYQAEQLAKKSKTPIDEEAVRRSFVARMQGSIDAINNTYATILANAKVQSANNTGIGRAVNARSGLLGSDFGNASDANITTANTASENAVENERLGKIGMILADANKSADAEITRQRSDQTQAQKDLMDNLLTRETRTAGVASKLAKALLAQGFKNVSELSPDDIKKIEADYGVDLPTLTSAFSGEVASNLKSTADIALTNAKTATELDTNRYKTIGDGAQLYDTKTGKVIENTKSYKSTGGVSTGGLSGYSGMGVDATTGKTFKLSNSAQVWVDKINRDGGKPQDYITGTSKEAQALRNEVQAGLNAQGGVGNFDKAKNIQLIDVVDKTVADIAKNKDLVGTWGTRTADNKWLNWSANKNTDFVNQVDKLQGQLLKLDGVALKAIFGPQISNSDASMIKEIIGNALDPKNQTKEHFQQSLDDITNGLAEYRKNNGVAPVSPSSAQKTQVVHNGVLYNVDANGDMTPAN